jgi:hypothetical protein
LALDAIVRVKLTYKGDMVRSSELTRREINERLENLAQQHCAQQICKEITAVSKRQNI